MFNLKREVQAPKPNHMETALDKALIQLYDMRVESEEMTAAVANVKVLCEAKAALDESAKKPAVSPDVLVTVVGNLIGIGTILSYEKVNVITTKAMGLLLKPKA